MAYEEYIDLINKCKSINTKYVLFALDGTAERKTDGGEFAQKSLELMIEMTNQFLHLEKQTGKKYLVTEDVELCKSINDLLKTKKTKKGLSCLYNPNFVSGDFISFYFYKDSITVDLFVDIFQKSAKIVNNKFDYHFSKQNYQTNDYLKGKNLLWVGYAGQYLERTKSGRLFDLNYKNVINDKNMDF